MVLLLNSDAVGRLFLDLLGNGNDGGFRGSDGLLRTFDGDVGDGGIALRSVNVDLGVSVVLDLVDAGPALSEDTSDGARRDGKLEQVVVVLLKLDSL